MNTDTAVSYIIVDGPRGNPELADGCGRFRVRHFGVATITDLVLLLSENDPKYCCVQSRY